MESVLIMVVSRGQPLFIVLVLILLFGLRPILRKRARRRAVSRGQLEQALERPEVQAKLHEAGLDPEKVLSDLEHAEIVSSDGKTTVRLSTIKIPLDQTHPGAATKATPPAPDRSAWGVRGDDRDSIWDDKSEPSIWDDTSPPTSTDRGTRETQ